MVMAIPTTMVIINSATIMKKLFKFVALAAIAATASVSCQKEMAAPEQPEITEKKEVQIKVTAVPQALAGAETRTYISNNTILWGTGEYMKLAVNTSFATSTDASADSFNGQSQATFSFSITPGQANKYTYMGLYPASAAGASPNTDPASYKVNLPNIQNATATSYDPAAYIMVAKPQEFTSVQDEWMASYRRATALNKITLKNLPSGISIKRVVITAPNKKLAGGRHIDLTSGESSDIYSNENTIEVKYDSTPLSGTNVDVWFTSWDVEVAAGETLTIVAYTSDNKSYTKTIEVPSGKSIKFQEGYLNTLGASFANITPDGVTVLEEGNYVVLAKDGNDYYALKAQKEDGKERLLSVSFTGNLTSYTGESDIIWTITKSGDSYIFENGGKYLGYKGSSNDSYWLMPDEAEGTWTGTNYLLDVTAQEPDGQFHVTVHSNSSRYLSKNSSGAFFAFYGNTSQKADIVFVPATIVNRTPVTLTFDENSVSKTTADYSSFTGQQATSAPEVSPITYSMTGDAIGNINESTGVVTLNGAAGTSTVTASFAGDETYAPASASYTIIVENPNVADYVNLDWSYPQGNNSATSSDLSAIYGVTTSGLGTDYASTNAPYQIKFDSTGDFIQIKTDSSIGKVSVKYKMIGGAKTSQLTFKQSVDGETWTDVQTLDIAGAENSTGVLTTSSEFDSDSRYVKIEFTKGSNVGIGGITISKPISGPIEHVATIEFGNQGTNINGASVTGNDSKNNEWTITTNGTDSFTPNTNYSQVGSNKKPATSITFTTTLPESASNISLEAKFGGFSGTAGTVNLKVGDDVIGSGSLNATNDVIVTSNSTGSGTVLTVTVTGISKGVKCYYIKATYTN